MASSSSATVQDVMKCWLQVPTKALTKRYMKATGADKAKAAAVLLVYKQFLALKIMEIDYDDEFLSPPPAVHDLWKEHILDTAAYAEHCRTLCGRVLHHAPDSDSEPQYTKQRHRTLAAYKKHFKQAAPAEQWAYGELPALSHEDQSKLLDDAPAAKRAKASGGAALTVSVQAPHLPLRTLSVRSDQTVRSFFQSFVEASGSTHLVAGRNATPPTTRLRCGNAWMHDVQQLADAGVKEGSVIYIAVPQDRHSREQRAVSIKDVAGGESATVFVRGGDGIYTLMRQAQDALGVPADCQQIIFRGQLLKADDMNTLDGCGIADGSVVQMAVGKRKASEATMSPGGTWR